MQTNRGAGGPLVSEFADDPEMAEIVELFVSELPRRVEALRHAWASGATADLTRLAHQLKGASAGYGFPTIGAAAERLEGGLKSGGHIASFKAHIDELAALCSRASGR